MSRLCSQCGNSGHNSRTCSDSAESATAGIMLFGVRITEGSSPSPSSMGRKSASMINLAQYEQQNDSNPDLAAGYASDDVVHASARSRERKRGVPWTEEEHKLFLLGLQKVGKGDWRGISRNFVKTRTPTQVASHAQKYFLRRNNNNRRRRRFSLFDITTDSENLANLNGIPIAPPTGDNYKTNCPVPLPPSSKMANLNLNNVPADEPLLPLSLKLSSSDQQPPPPSRKSSGFQSMSGSFSSSSGGDSMISVA